MPATKRATVEFDPKVHEAVVRQAKDTDSSISDVVNAVLRDVLIDDEDDEYDLAEFERRRHEPTIPFEEYLAKAKRRDGR